MAHNMAFPDSKVNEANIGPIWGDIIIHLMYIKAWTIP